MGKIRNFHVAKKVNAELRWVPGHSEIIGNKEVDSKARAALSLLPSRQTPLHHISLAYLRRLMHQSFQYLVD